MRLFYMSMTTGSRFIFESSDHRKIVQDMENGFYNSMCLEEASSYNEIELISCLLQTLVNKDYVNSSFKNYLVGMLNETKKELFDTETKLQKILEKYENLRDKYMELLNKKKE